MSPYKSIVNLLAIFLFIIALLFVDLKKEYDNEEDYLSVELNEDLRNIVNDQIKNSYNSILFTLLESEELYLKSKFDSSLKYAKIALGSICGEEGELSKYIMVTSLGKIYNECKNSGINIYNNEYAIDSILLILKNSFQLGSFDKSIEFSNSFLPLEKQIETLKMSNIYSVLGSIYFKVNDINHAISYFKKAEEMLYNIGMESSVEYSRVLNNLGAAYYHKNNYRKAINYMYSSYDLVKKIQGEKNISPIKLMNIGVISELSGNLQEAKYFYKKSYDSAYGLYNSIYRREVVSIIANLANVENRIGNTVQSLRLFEFAISVYDMIVDTKDLTYVNLMKNYAEVYSLVDPVYSVELLEKTMVLSKKHENSSELILRLLLSIIEIKIDLGKMSEVGKYIRQGKLIIKDNLIESKYELIFENLLNLYCSSHYECDYSVSDDSELLDSLKKSRASFDSVQFKLIEYSIYIRKARFYNSGLNENDKELYDVESIRYYTLAVIALVNLRQLNMSYTETGKYSEEWRILRKEVLEYLYYLYDLKNGFSLVEEKHIHIILTNLKVSPKIADYNSVTNSESHLVTEIRNSSSSYFQEKSQYINSINIEDLKSHLKNTNTAIFDYYKIRDILYVFFISGNSIGLSKIQLDQYFETKYLQLINNHGYDTSLGEYISCKILPKKYLLDNEYLQLKNIVIIQDSSLPNLSFSGLDIDYGSSYHPLIMKYSVMYALTINGYINEDMPKLKLSSFLGLSSSSYIVNSIDLDEVSLSELKEVENEVNMVDYILEQSSKTNGYSYNSDIYEKRYFFRNVE